MKNACDLVHLTHPSDGCPGAAQFAGIVVGKNDTPQTLTETTLNALGERYKEYYYQTPALQEHLAGVFENASPGSVVNLSDYWRDAIGLTVSDTQAWYAAEREPLYAQMERLTPASDSRYLRNPKWLETAISSDPLAPPAFREQVGSELFTDVLLEVGTLVAPELVLGRLARPLRAWAVEGRVGGGCSKQCRHIFTRDLYCLQGSRWNTTVSKPTAYCR